MKKKEKNSRIYFGIFHPCCLSFISLGHSRVFLSGIFHARCLSFITLGHDLYFSTRKRKQTVFARRAGLMSIAPCCFLAERARRAEVFKQVSNNEIRRFRKKNGRGGGNSPAVIFLTENASGPGLAVFVFVNLDVNAKRSGRIFQNKTPYF